MKTQAPITRREADAAHTPVRKTIKDKLLRGVCILIVVLASVEYVIATVATQVRTPPARTDFASYWLAGELAAAKQSPYPPAALAARGRALGLGYDQYPFLYPPPFALAMQPLSRLGFSEARALWVVLSSLFLFAAIAATVRLTVLSSRALDLREARYGFVLLAAFVPAALNATSTHNDVRAGSVGALLFLLFVLLAWSLSTRRATMAGVCLALATLVKLFPIALLPYVWWRGGRRAGFITCSALAAAHIAAIVHWGPGILVSYWSEALQPLFREPNVWPHNQSLDAFLGRLLVGNDEVVTPVRAPELAAALSVSISLGLLAATVTVLREPLRRAAPRLRSDAGAARLSIELGVLVLLLLIVMKITWVHTLTGMLFVWPLLMLPIVRAGEQRPGPAVRLGILACTGFFLSSAHLPLLWGSRFKTWPGTLLTGVHLLGLLILWWCCVLVLRHAHDWFAFRHRTSAS